MKTDAGHPVQTCCRVLMNAPNGQYLPLLTDGRSEGLSFKSKEDDDRQSSEKTHFFVVISLVLFFKISLTS